MHIPSTLRLSASHRAVHAHSTHRPVHSTATHRRQPRATQTNRALGTARSTIRTKSVLSNGIRVLSETLPEAQSFALGVWVNAGSCDETKPEQGIAHLLEHLVFRGTAKRSALTIANYLESVGGYVNAFTTKDHTCYYTRALTAHFSRSLDLLLDIVFKPLLRESDLEKERAIILDEIKSLEDEPEERINDVLDASLFGRHRYAHPISGSESSVRALTAERVRAFHQRLYIPDNIVIAVAGNIHHEAVVRTAERLIADMHLEHIPPSRPAIRRTAPILQPAQHHNITDSVQQAHYMLGTITTRPTDAEYYALAALNIILGDGMSSRLNQSIREKRGLCYNVSSSISEMQDCALVSIYAAMELSNLEKTKSLIRYQLDDLAHHRVSKTELRRAKEQLKSSLIIGLESLSGRMNLLAKSELYLGRYDELTERIAAIESVSEDDIMSLVQHFLGEPAWHSVTMLPDTEKSELVHNV
jgi:predicted Zn-dependent peptidase